MASRGESSFNAPMVTTLPPKSAQGIQWFRYKPTQGRSNVTPAITEGTDFLKTFALEDVGELDKSNGGGRRAGGASKEFLQIFLSLFTRR